MTRALLIVGYGHAGRALAMQAKRGRKVFATTRSSDKLSVIDADGVTPVLMNAAHANVFDAFADADMAITFPPDGKADAALAAALPCAGTAVYISTTGVYGPSATRVDEHTRVDESDARAQPRLHAERVWREAGASIVRAPAIYGPESGLHKRLARGDFKMVDDGESYVSRIHVDDLAQVMLAILDQRVRGETFVVGDHEPATQRTVLQWLATRMNVPMPGSVARDDAPASLRANRRVDPSYALQRLGVTLRYPTFREGLDACLAAGV